MGPHPPAPCLTHREGLWRLLELSKKPIFIVFESQYREITHPAISLLKQHRNLVTLLVWRAGSMVRARSHPASTPLLDKSAPFCVHSVIRSPVLLRGVPQPKQQNFVPMLPWLLTSQGRAMSCMQQVGPVSLPPCGHAAMPGAQLSPWPSSQLQRERAEPHRACHSPTRAGLGFAAVLIQLGPFLPHADPVIGLLERAVPGPAPQGVLPGDHGGPADPAAGGQGPHADPA